MKRSRTSIGKLLQPLALAVALALATSFVAMAETSCVPLELSPCIPALSSPVSPSGMCCQKLREQQPCFCGYMRIPALAPYVGNPRAREICKSCGVPIPRC
ncbi:hypothetical protein MLD38_022785 [Melastoma candidum]|uniref:Uncharacterized protein n=1 Tax=Melastoma candidum TaxID=119954 RepID=A0ACB9QNH6_9MYRT|nr:hypothetical protein MLD38_022785 [Melastoma candidum]